ncbi:BTAD domain-containing putative transcriptional regulator [Streptomyces collinus]|uniref:BTAD domain-containing putative transcriptional regulator n=1 Tax=Streptomyces collinus TaxID=42684 RepID=UPI00364309A1
MRRYELRFGLLGPPVLYDRQPYGISYDASDSTVDADSTADADSTPDNSVRAIGSPKVRALLVALLLEAGRVVSVESLKDALWSGAPPVSAQASLHNHVTRLRRLLDDPERLRAVAPGYLLRVDDGELDVHVFEARVAEARAAHARSDWAGVVRPCTAALSLWRGAPLSGLPADFGGYAFVQRLEEARRFLLEWRYDAELALGGARVAGLVPELAALVAEHPLREAYHRQLMLALHRTGRQAEALAVHRDLRARLVDELGIEPGPAVRQAHVEVLRGSSDTPRVPAARTGGAVPPRRVSSGAAAGVAVGGVPAGGASAGGVPAGGPVDGGAPVGGALAATPVVGGALAGGPVATAILARSTLAPGEGRPGEPTIRDASAPTPAPEFAPAPESAPTSVSAAAPTPEFAPAPESAPTSVSAATSTSEFAPPPVSASTSVSAAPSTPASVPLAATGGEAARTGEGPVSPASGTAAPRIPAPAQLPPPPANFTGRAAEHQELHQSLAERRSRLAVISGMAGVGKSALALHVAHGLRERFPDGQLYVNLHGAAPGTGPLTSAQALAALLRDLGAEPRTIPEHPDAAAALLRSLLAPARVLLVLDDAASAAQVRPLLPAGPGCAVIVTSRSPLTALDGARRLPLGPLTGEDSAALLRAVSGRAGLDAGHALVELTGRLPLALRVVAARLAARRALTPDVLAGQLAATGGRLHHLEYDDLSVRRSLAVAHDALAAADREADRDAALVLRRIGALDLPSYSAPLVARLTGTDARRAEAALDRLVDVALLEETAFGRYAPHDLVRDFARELADADARPGTVAGGDGDRTAGSGPERRTSPDRRTGVDRRRGTDRRRADDRRTDTAFPTDQDRRTGASTPAAFPAGEDRRADTGSPIGEGRRTDTSSPAGDDRRPDTGSSAGQDCRIDTAIPTGQDRRADTGIPAGQDRRIDTAIPAGQDRRADTGIPAGEDRRPDTDSPIGQDCRIDTDSPAGQDCRTDTGSPTDQDRRTGTSTPTATPTGPDRRTGSSTPTPTAAVTPAPTPGADTDLAALRWYAAAAECVLTAIVEPGLDQEDRRRPTAAQPPGHAADVVALGSFESAEVAFAWGDGELENIVALVERNADGADERRAAHLSLLVRLFFPYVQRSGRVAEMEVLGRAGLGAARRLGDAAAEAYALGDLSGLHFLAGRQNDALALTDQALAIWRRLGAVSRIRRCLNNRGLLLEGLGRFEESGEALRQSLGYSRQLNDPYGEAVTRSHLGNLYEHTDPRAAIEQHRRSLAIGDALGAVIVQHSAHCNIGYAHLTLGEPAAAAGHFEESLRILGGHGDWHGESQTRLGLVRALRRLGDGERAARECAELLSRADARADRYMGGLARHQHGLLLREEGRRPEARDVWRAALAALDGTDEQTVMEELRELLAEGSGR